MIRNLVNSTTELPMTINTFNDIPQTNHDTLLLIKIFP